MKSFTSHTNPFVLMLDPEAVISAMENSTHLRGLRQQRLSRANRYPRTVRGG